MAPVARNHTAAPSGWRACASTVQPALRPFSFNRTAPASPSPRATSATPIAARSHRRISAFTQIALFSRASMADGRCLLQPREGFDTADVAVAMDHHEAAVVEQHVGAGALAAGEFSDR